MTAGKAIFQILNLDEDVAALVDGRIFPELAAQDAATPYVTYHIRNVEPEDTKSGTSTLDVVTFDLYCVGPDYGELQDVAEACRTAIDRQAGNFNSTAIQSARYMDEDCDFDQGSRDYIATQTFEVRHQRTGTIIDMANITIQEADGTPSASVGTLIFPNGSLSVSGETGTINFANFTFSRRSCSSTYLVGGASAQDFNSSTPTAINFDETDAETASNGFTYGVGFVRLPASAFYRITARVVFVVESGSGSAPHVLINIDNTRDLEGEGTAYLPGTHGVDHAAAVLTMVYEGTANEAIRIKAYDESNQNASIKMNSAFLEIERLT